MRETDKKKTQNSNQIKHSARAQRKESKVLGETPRKTPNGRGTPSKASHAKTLRNGVVTDTNISKEPSEVYDNVVIHYLDDVYRSQDTHQDVKLSDMVEEKDGILDEQSADLDGESVQVKEEESDAETVKDSASSQGDSVTAEDEKIRKTSRVPRKLVKKDSPEASPRASRLRSTNEKTKPALKWSNATPKKTSKFKNDRELRTDSSDSKSKSMSTSSSESSEGGDDKPNEEPKEEAFDEASNADKSVASDLETASTEHGQLHNDGSSMNSEESNGVRNIEHDDQLDGLNQNDVHQDSTALNQKIEEMETRIEKLEEELREVAALEISLYSIVPEHGSSAHKVHTPARRLSRLYIHACKYWTQNKRATVARNAVSGLILVARTCGNDVARLTFWLSNTVVLREVISQAFGVSCQSTPAVFTGPSSNGKTSVVNSSLKLKGSIGGKLASKVCSTQTVEDWQETGTFTAALEKVESWMFSRIVESVWWQTLTQHMQSPPEDLNTNSSLGRVLGPALGDQQQGSFSIDLWKTAFTDASRRLCPVRAAGHECGCLPVLARLVMEQCVARLDVAMFNAILRESAHQIPTDPVSDPILDPKVLPIPAGDLSFGSGAQLKNAVGNWTRCVTDLFGLGNGYPVKDQNDGSKDDGHQAGQTITKCFHLLDELSDLLMLPKDMLMDWSVRKEVCPSISLPLVKRILCNFSPDEFCPDHVPGEVLEVLNAESVVERRLSGDSAGSFPYSAALVVYSCPSSDDVAEKVAEAGGKSHLERNASVIQRKGYTSDEELEDLDSPLTSFVENLPLSPTVLQLQNGNGSLKLSEQPGSGGLNVRYKLLLEVWSV